MVGHQLEMSLYTTSIICCRGQQSGLCPIVLYFKDMPFYVFMYQTEVHVHVIWYSPFVSTALSVLASTLNQTGPR